MKKIDLLQVPIYEFQGDKGLAETVLQQVRNLNFRDNIQNNISVLHYTNTNLLTWFQTCIDQVHNLYYHYNLKLEIVSCWANKTNRNEKHHLHTHPNSIVSGVYYLTDHKDSETIFYIDDPWMKLENENILRVSKNKNITSQKTFITNTVSPEMGKLILFPSHITHETKPHRQNVPRYSIAFNTFFTGKFYQDDNQPVSSITTYLEINSKNI